MRQRNPYEIKKESMAEIDDEIRRFTPDENFKHALLRAYRRGYQDCEDEYHALKEAVLERNSKPANASAEK